MNNEIKDEMEDKMVNDRRDVTKDKVFLFVIGVLVGAVISTGAFFAYIKLAGVGNSAQVQGGGTPPEMPGGSNSQSGTPPEMPSGDNSSNNQGGTPPEKPSGDNSGEGNSSSEDSGGKNSSSGNSNSSTNN